MNLEKLFSHLKKLSTSLSTGQLAGLIGVFVAVVGVVIASAFWISTPNYTLLVADMDAETASSVVSKLKAAKVQYELTDGGRSVRVPDDRVDELRLQFASNGLPSAGRIGFEIFDRPAFGTTEFLEHVNYRRALEGELARTISTLSEVASARVHIAMGKDSLFVDQSQPAKASVVLKLKGNRPLAPSTAKGIAGLVAGSVEALRPESVVILDTFGRPLSKPEEDSSPAAGAQFDRQQQIERDMTARVVALLEPVVGAGRVRVNVSAILKSDLVEETEERWDPAGVVRSRQSTTESAISGATVGGVAGARANQPPALSTSTASGAASGTPPPAATNTPTLPATPPANGTLPANGTAPANTTSPAASNAVASTTIVPGSTRTSEVTNYEVGKVTRHTVSPQGQLARLSVAVILDDERVASKAADGTAQTTSKPWDQPGIQRIQNLVVAAVGLDQKRGDQLTVENIAFDVPAEVVDPPAPGFGTQAMDAVKTYWPSALRGAAILGLAIFALFGILRPLAKRATTFTSAPALPAPAGAARLPTVQEMEGSIDAEIEAGKSNHSRRLPVLTKRVAKLASDEPEQLARIVRGWISEEER